MEHKFTTHIGSNVVELSTGKMAQQAGGAVIVKSGDTMLLATATAADKPREGVDFFPLSVDFEERLYVAGRFRGDSSSGRPATDRPSCSVA